MTQCQGFPRTNMIFGKKQPEYDLLNCGVLIRGFGIRDMSCIAQLMGKSNPHHHVNMIYVCLKNTAQLPTVDLLISCFILGWGALATTVWPGL